MNETIAQLPTMLKALVSGLIAFVSALGASLTTGESLGDLDAKTWLAAVVAGLLGLGIVYVVPNRPAAKP